MISPTVSIIFEVKWDRKNPAGSGPHAGLNCPSFSKKKHPFVSPKNKEMGSVRLEFDFRTKGQPKRPKKETYQELIDLQQHHGDVPGLHPFHQSRSGTANFDAASLRARYKIGLSRMSHKLGGDECNLHRTTCVRDIEMLRDYTRS